MEQPLYLQYPRLYRIYQGMRYRCYNKTNPGYHNYGGRGIFICDEWYSDVKKFIDWALLNGYQESLTIDRIDNDKGYSPENCRWATSKEQGRNKRSNYFISYRGEVKALSDWCEILKLDYRKTYIKVAFAGQTLEQISAGIEPEGEEKRYFYNGRFITLAEKEAEIKRLAAIIDEQLIFSQDQTIILTKMEKMAELKAKIDQCFTFFEIDSKRAERAFKIGNQAA